MRVPPMRPTSGSPQAIRRATRSSIARRAANASGAGWEEDGVRGHSAGDSASTSAWARPASELVTGSLMGTMSFIGEEALLVPGVGRGDAAMVLAWPSDSLDHPASLFRNPARRTIEVDQRMDDGQPRIAETIAARLRNGLRWSLLFGWLAGAISSRSQEPSCLAMRFIVACSSRTDSSR